MRASVVHPRLSESNNPVSKDDIIQKIDDPTTIRAKWAKDDCACMPGKSLYSRNNKIASSAKPSLSEHDEPLIRAL